MNKMVFQNRTKKKGTKCGVEGIRIKWALVHLKPNSANKRSTLHSAPPDHLILKLVTPPLSSSPNRKEREEKRRGSVTCWIEREKLALRLKMTKRNLRSKETTIGEDAELLFQKKIRDLESVNESLKVFPSSHHFVMQFFSDFKI